MKYTIKDLAEGKCAVLNDGTLEQLVEVLKKAFPNDTSELKGMDKFYYSWKAREGEWSSYDSTNLPYQSVKDFLEEDFVLPEKWAVRRTEDNAKILNEYFNKLDKCNGDYCHVPSGHRYDYIHSEFVEETLPRRVLPYHFEKSLKEEFTEISFEQFKKYVMKETPLPVNSRFPFKLTYENAKRIIDVACSNWKEKLSKEWGPQFLLNDYIGINEAFYKEMRNACNKQQNEVFDDIFGKDEIPCPYKDGELILVRHNENSEWQVRYSIGKFNKHSEAGAYDAQKKSGLVVYWKFHAKLGNGNIKLPE